VEGAIKYICFTFALAFLSSFSGSSAKFASKRMRPLSMLLHFVISAQTGWTLPTTDIGSANKHLACRIQQCRRLFVDIGGPSLSNVRYPCAKGILHIATSASTPFCSIKKACCTVSILRVKRDLRICRLHAKFSRSRLPKVQLRPFSFASYTRILAFANCMLNMVAAWLVVPAKVTHASSG